MLLAYNLALLFLSPLWVPWMLWRTSRRKEKPNWSERMGNYVGIRIPKEQKAIWVHAVSVGEVMAALPILAQLRELCPEHYLLLSVTTSSGHSAATEHAKMVDRVAYMPIDLLRFQLSAVMRVRPSAVAIMETELWMSFLWAAKTVGASTLLVNGRVSDRSFRRSVPIRFFYRSLFRYVDQTLAQTQADADRLAAYGAKNPQVFGSSKADEAIDGLEADPAWWKQELGLPEGRPVIVVGSTRGPEEEALVLAALPDDASIVWAPRHLERADALAAQLAQRFGGVARRSQGEKGRVVLLDTYGELGRVYSAADVVIVGGGFANLGGQNLIQPMAHGKPVLHGPHMQNFRSAAEAARSAGAARTCATSDELRAAIADALGPAGKAMGMAGAQLVRESAGSARKYAEAIAACANK